MKPHTHTHTFVENMEDNTRGSRFSSFCLGGLGPNVYHEILTLRERLRFNGISFFGGFNCCNVVMHITTINHKIYTKLLQCVRLLESSHTEPLTKKKLRNRGEEFYSLALPFSLLAEKIENGNGINTIEKFVLWNQRNYKQLYFSYSLTHSFSLSYCLRRRIAI